MCIFGVALSSLLHYSKSMDANTNTTENRYWYLTLARNLKIAAMRTRTAGYEAFLPRKAGL